MDTPPPVTPTPTASTVLAPAEAQVRTWSMLAHLSALAGFVIPFGSIIGPLLVWQIKKHEMPAVVEHAKEVLNFQISCIIYLIVCIPLMFVIIGLPLMVAIGLFSLVCIIIASLKANDGKPWKYPLTIRFLN